MKTAGLCHSIKAPWMQQKSDSQYLASHCKLSYMLNAFEVDFRDNSMMCILCVVTFMFAKLIESGIVEASDITNSGRQTDNFYTVWLFINTGVSLHHCSSTLAFQAKFLMGLQCLLGWPTLLLFTPNYLNNVLLHENFPPLLPD